VTAAPVHVDNKTRALAWREHCFGPALWQYERYCTLPCHRGASTIHDVHYEGGLLHAAIIVL
jgi:hypothetical protein